MDCSKIKRRKEWIIDSGATDHMSPHREKFTSYNHRQGRITVAGGGKLSSRGYGNIVTKWENSDN
jgi:hypothetical protein